MTPPIDIWLCDPHEGDFPVAYGASFSPLLRLACSVDEGGKGKVKEQVEDLVRYFEEHGEELGLKKPFPDGMYLRQVDLRTKPDGPIILKTWTGWQSKKERWLVFVEGGNENYWEKRGMDGFDPEMN